MVLNSSNQSLWEAHVLQNFMKLLMCLGSTYVVVSFVAAFIIQVVLAMPTTGRCSSQWFLTMAFQHSPEGKVVINDHSFHPTSLQPLLNH
ncbi:hypothetical protein BUE76_10470 [Cnuella takakiae]|nr:hypothetical protein BUE76_10470 [Cnuella takakiae]